MSYSKNRAIKATRKEHHCDSCNKVIPVGSPAEYWAGDCDGEFYAAYFHTDCRAAEVAMNHKNDTWGDEWDSLELVREEPDEAAWLREAFPEVAKRMGVDE